MVALLIAATPGRARRERAFHPEFGIARACPSAAGDPVYPESGRAGARRTRAMPVRAPRRDARRRWLGLLAALAAGLGASSRADAGSLPVERQESYAASRLAVAGLVGSLRVERHDGAKIRLVLRGSARSRGYAASSMAIGCS
jgi:hypothetical protein